MITRNTSHPVNTLSFLSEEMERTLRLRAWKDEIFREALIADPKGVIQRVFPQCFPNGKLPEQMTIKVIEEDLYTHHIVVPSLPDEFPTLEIPEEEQLEFVANMGYADRMLGKRDSSDNKGESQLSEKTKPLDLLKDSFKRQQAEEVAKKQETAREPLTREKIESLAKKDEEFRKKLVEVSNNASHEKKQEMLMKTLQEYFPHHFNESNLSERQTFKVTQDTADTHHIVLPKLPDASPNPVAPEGKQLGPQFSVCKTAACTNACSTKKHC